MGTFGGYPQKVQILRLNVQIETRQNRSFPHLNHQPITVSRENVGTLLVIYVSDFSLIQQGFLDTA
jgi:PHD/YefM family antitoxin component YafN of YafNO toxin-antitoxin module